MALPAFATVDDVVAEMGTVTDEERTERLLAKASNLIRSESGRTWVDDDGELDGTEFQLEILRDITTSVTIRCLRNPSGIVQETAGPFSQSFDQNTQPSVWLTKTEKAQIAQLVGGSGLTTISTTRGPVEMPSGRCDGLDADALLT